MPTKTNALAGNAAGPDLSETGRALARRVAERLRKRIAEHRQDAREGPPAPENDPNADDPEALTNHRKA